MAAQQNFRSAFNGFNREDVVHYLEFINAKHTAQVNQLTAENEELREKLEAQPEEDLVASLQEECASLRAQLEEALAEKVALEERCAQLEEQQSQSVSEDVAPSPSAELEAYRRAERAERSAKERAAQIYDQANAVLADVTVRTEDAANKLKALIAQVADQLQLTEQELQGAVSALYAIRPEKD